jgi:5S rRNA maturation endonuclease (ribonuclease M5)
MNPSTLAKYLEKLPARYGLTRKGSDFLIRCPDHAGGNERTPSFVINGDDSKRFKLGAGHCFSCGANYKSWHETLNRLGGGDASLASNADVMDLQVYDITKGFRKSIKEGSGFKKSEIAEIRASKPWPKDRNWRGIPGKTLVKIKARLSTNKFGYDRLFIPAYVGGKLKGGVFANIKKHGKRNYFNMSGDWANLILVFIDYVKDTFGDDLDTIVIVEGPRDALRLLSWGIPAVAMLGTGHAVNPNKFDLLSSLDLKSVVLAFDGDDAGRSAYRAAKETLKKEYKVYRVKFPEGEDVCSVGEEKISRIKTFVQQHTKNRLPKRQAIS